MLTGKAKTDYMREYMRRRRSNARSNKGSNDAATVRPKKSVDMSYPQPYCQSAVVPEYRPKTKELTYERDDYSQ